MKLHLVGGFLGSGKTTAIIGAAKTLMQQGQRVGVITNDQGKYLVDTAFFELANIPTVEVSGGCFCCNYDDLDSHLTQLIDSARPDVIFAESVGSCADVVATVVKPLLELKSDTLSPHSFSVFADARLLRMWLLGKPLPFADNVIYIFEKQLEEAGLLVINKIDLLTADEITETMSLTLDRFGAKVIHAQNSLTADGVNSWLAALSNNPRLLPEQSLEIDYQRYGAGEAELAWLDETITLTVEPHQGQAVVRKVIETITVALADRQIPIGHLKFFVSDGEQGAKISFPTLNDTAVVRQVPPLAGGTITLTVNARAEVAADTLRQLVQQATKEAAGNAVYQESNVACFHPAQPQPTHRFN
jgi:Ni2+-binding GTPase involved in maturation of urease and hydrogenase